VANQVFRGQELASEVRPWQWLGRTAGGRYAGLGRIAGGERRAEGSRFERSAWAPRIQRGEERMGHGMGVAVGGGGSGDSFRCSVPRPRDAMGILPQPAGASCGSKPASGARGCDRWRRYREALPTSIVMQD
jgi:hypothetical protein